MILPSNFPSSWTRRACSGGSAIVALCAHSLQNWQRRPESFAAYLAASAAVDAFVRLTRA